MFFLVVEADCLVAGQHFWAEKHKPVSVFKLPHRGEAELRATCDRKKKEAKSENNQKKNTTKKSYYISNHPQTKHI